MSTAILGTTATTATTATNIHIDIDIPPISSQAAFDEFQELSEADLAKLDALEMEMEMEAVGSGSNDSTNANINGGGGPDPGPSNIEGSSSSSSSSIHSIASICLRFIALDVLDYVDSRIKEVIHIMYIS